MMTSATTMTKLSLAFLSVVGLGATLVAVSAQGTDQVSGSTPPVATTSADLQVSPNRATAESTIADSGAVPIYDEPAEFTHEPPSNDEAFEALVKKKFPEARVYVDKTGETAERPRIYPLAGLCQQVTAHYKCTIEYLADPQSHRRAQEIVYVDKNYLRRVPGSGANPSDKQEQPSKTPVASPSGDQERRLRTVEEKLDRVLKVLESGQNQTPKELAR